MPRNLRAKEHAKAAKARREFALERNELREESEPRVPAAGVTSLAIKTNPDAALIEAYLQKREKT